MNTKNFKAQKLSKTASITLNGPIATLFPLFGAFEERKWAKGWNPTLIYPESEIIEEGTTFVTSGNEDEKKFLWRVSKYSPEDYLIQYLVSTENRFWTITVKCTPDPDNRTLATITYTYIGLNDAGNRLNQFSIDKMYAENLKDWEAELNNFLGTQGLAT